MLHEGRLELTWTNKELTLLSKADGRYDYSWVDPGDFRASEIRLLHEIETVSAPTPVDSSVVPTSGNLLITGDAMHALASIQKIPEYADKYLGQVKLAYIDPPFNTGQAFTHYDDKIEHSIWLTMLRDRLKQIKPLLSPDGSIWVHLDDAEVHRCRAVMDEELGPGNFVGTVIWQKAYSPRNDAKGLSTDQDYILVYSMNPGWVSNRLDRLASRDALYTTPDGDPNSWVSGDPAAPGSSSHQGMVYGVQSPVTGEMIYPAKGRHWSTKQAALQDLLEEWGVNYEARDIGDEIERARICALPTDDVRKGVRALMLVAPIEQTAPVILDRIADGNWPRLYFTKGGRGGLKLKRYLDEVSQTRAPQTLWLHEEVGHSRTGKAELRALFPELTPFATPKPEALIAKILKLATLPGEIVLDCFAGSGTTAAVAHKMGRRWVTSELLAETVETFTKPRLLQVIRGTDTGGTSSTTERLGAENLPEGLNPEEAYAFSGMLTKFAKADPTLGAATIKALRDAAKTQVATTVNWLGGGSFTHVEVGASMFEEVDGRVFIADWAVHGELARAVCAQLSIAYEPDGVFAGREGSTRVVVLDGLVNTSTLESILGLTDSGELITVWATQIEAGAEAALTTMSLGSRISKIPDAILDGYRIRQATVSRFATEEI